MEITTKKIGTKTTSFTIIIPWNEASKAYEETIDIFIKDVSVKGFRKGRAPKSMAKNQLKESAVLEETLKKLATTAYQNALKQHTITPVGRPKIEALAAEKEKDWKLRITVSEKPTVDLKNYKEQITEFKKGKSTKIWLPGEKKTPENAKETKPTIGEILDVLYKSITVKVSDLLIEQEVEQRLSQLLQDAQKLGLTVDRYLQSTGKTIDQVKNEYKVNSEKTLALEFALEEIAQIEKVTVEDSDIDAFINKAKSAKEKKSLQGQRYYLAGLLRRQKVLNFLSSL